MYSVITLLYQGGVWVRVSARQACQVFAGRSAASSSGNTLHVYDIELVQFRHIYLSIFMHKYIEVRTYKLVAGTFV